MEYQKIINLLNNRNTQPSRFRKRNWVEINDQSNRRYNTNIRFKTTMLSQVSVTTMIQIYLYREVHNS